MTSNRPKIRVAMIARLSIVSCVVGGAGIFLVVWLSAFEPCRALYRVHNAIQETVQCQVFSAVGFIGIILLSVGSITGVISAYLAITPRSRVNDS
jgi:hypothetical protein